MRGTPVTAAVAMAFLLVSAGTRLVAAEMAFQILHEFGPGSGPQFPLGTLIEGEDGQFFGISRNGGAYDKGTIYRITPQGPPTVLHSFDGITVDGPNGIAQAGNGDFYGFARDSSTFDTILFRFRTNDSSFSTVASYSWLTNYPHGWLTWDGSASFYGVNGPSGDGFVFRITTNGSFTVIFSFDGTNGVYPLGRLLTRGDGMLYGVTTSGGNGYVGGYSGHGTVFKVTTNGIHTTLASFNLTNGSAPSWHSELGQRWSDLRDDRSRRR